jgi:hypothetical protein
MLRAERRRDDQLGQLLANHVAAAMVEDPFGCWIEVHDSFTIIHHDHSIERGRDESLGIIMIWQQLESASVPL